MGVDDVDKGGSVVFEIGLKDVDEDDEDEEEGDDENAFLSM